jgi:TonB family protein
MLREEFYGKNMSMDKVNAEYMTACRTIHCLNGVNYITMKNGKQKKFEYKNGFEKPEKKQEDFFNSIGSRSIGVKLREPLNYHLEPVIDSMPLVTTENDSLDTLLVRVQKTIFQGVAIRLYTSPNYNDALTAWQKLKPAQNDLIALLSTEYPYQSAIVVGNSLSLKLKNNLYEMREFASFILKIYPESSHSFQAIYKGINNACETIRIENKYTANPKGKKPKVENNNPIFTLVEEMPQFPGGNDSLLVFIQYNVVYPKDAIENDIQGKVFVRFVVYDTGEIGNIEVMKSVHPSLDDEAVLVIAEMPLWQPGKQQGKPVNCYYNIPVNFRLD